MSPVTIGFGFTSDCTKNCTSFSSYELDGKSTSFENYTEYRSVYFGALSLLSLETLSTQRVTNTGF